MPVANSPILLMKPKMGRTAMHTSSTQMIDHFQQDWAQHTPIWKILSHEPFAILSFINNIYANGIYLPIKDSKVVPITRANSLSILDIISLPPDACQYYSISVPQTIMHSIIGIAANTFHINLWITKLMGIHNIAQNTFSPSDLSGRWVQKN